MPQKLTMGDVRPQPDKQGMPVIRLSKMDQAPIVLREPDDDGRVRSEIQLMAGGTFQHFWFGELIFDSVLFDQMVGNFNEGIILRQIALDVDHDMTMAYGWIESLRRRGEDQEATLHATIRWTTPGMDLINGELYKYTSAEMGFNWEDNKGETHGPTLLGTALTNRPYITGMEELTLCASEFTEYFGTAPAGDATASNTGSNGGMAFDQRPVVVDLVDSITDQTAGTSTTPTVLTPEGTDPMLLSENVLAALIKSGLFAEEGDTPEMIEGKFIASMRTELGLGEGGDTDDATLVAAIEAVFTAQGDADPAPASDVTPAAVPTPTPAVDPAPAATVADATPVKLTETPEPVTSPIPATGEIAEVVTLTAQVVQMQTDMKALTDQNELLMAERAETASKILLDDARATGKTTPAMETAFLTELSRGDPQKFVDMIASLPEPTVAPTDAPRGVPGEGNAVVGMNTGAETKFIARVHAVMESEKIDYPAAFIAVKSGKLDEGDLMLSNDYMDEAGRGTKQRRDDIRTAADHLRKQGIKVG